MSLVKRLHYDLGGNFRLRIGKLRVLYSINEERKEIYIEKIVFDHSY